VNPWLSIGVGLLIALGVLGAAFVAIWLMGHNNTALVETPTLIGDEARAIDPDNPPHWMTYNPRRDDGTVPPRCTCHRQQLARGDRVLFWPIPGMPGAIDVFCMGTVTEALREEPDV
jgi:hypothetical protein